VNRFGRYPAGTIAALAALLGGFLFSGDAPAGTPSPQPMALERAARILHDSVATLEGSRAGLEVGIEVRVEGQGVLFRRAAEEAKPAASAIKTFIALDLLRERGDRLNQAPEGLAAFLRPGIHEAFAGFTDLELDAARRELAGMTWWELARVMMGRTREGNGVYNAACNLIMIKLGGPTAIGERVRRLDPAFAGVDLNRYMMSWHADGDNMATPRALAALYRMTSAGRVPGLDPDRVARLRELLVREGDGAPGSRFEKAGTLYPQPMVRVRAGYVERGDRDLVYAVMGRMRPGERRLDPPDAFVFLLAAVDTLTSICRDLS